LPKLENLKIYWRQPRSHSASETNRIYATPKMTKDGNESVTICRLAEWFKQACVKSDCEAALMSPWNFPARKIAKGQFKRNM
jgi:hypothetical protein